MSNPTSRKLHAVTEIATAVVEPFRFINFAGTHAMPSDAIQGVSEQGAAVGQAFSVVTGYSALVLAAVAIAAGNSVGPAADGTGRAVLGGAFVALDDAGAGELVEVRLAAAALLSESRVAALANGLAARGAVTAVMLCGDSNTSFWFDQGPTVTAIVNNGDGTGTVTFNASHNWTVGHPITVNASTDRVLNSFSGTVTAMLNTNPYWVTYTLTNRTSPVTSGSASGTGCLYPLRTAPLGFATWLQALQSKRLAYVNACAGGADSGQILTMYRDALEEAQAAKVSDVVVMAGTNDIYARGWDFATTQASLKALIDYIVSTTTARIWWCNVLPYGSSGGAWSAGKQVIHNRINRWIWRYGQQIGVTVVDTWRAAQNGLTMVNPAAGNPDFTTGFAGADVTHTANLGALALARSLDTLMRQAASVQPLMFQGGHSAIHGQGNAFANPSLTGTAGTKTVGSGTITGTVPDSWTVENTSGTGTLTLTSPVRTVAADGDASGNNLQVVPSVSANTWRLINSTSIHSAVTAGEVREASIPLTITGAAGLTGIELVVFGTKSSGGNENFGFVGASNAITGDFGGVIRAPRWTVPANLTNLLVFLRFTGATAGTFVIGKPSFELIE